MAENPLGIAFLFVFAIILHVAGLYALDYAIRAVQDRLEALYEADGRHDPDHPMHSTYTGLVAAQKQEVSE